MASLKRSGAFCVSGPVLPVCAASVSDAVCGDDFGDRAAKRSRNDFESMPLGLDDADTDVESSVVEVAQPVFDVPAQLAAVKERAPADTRVLWHLYAQAGSAGGMSETECRGKAQAVALRIMSAPDKTVCHVKFGYTTDPYWRFTTLPHNPESECTVEPHYLRFSTMYVLYGGSGSSSSDLEQVLISRCRDSKCGEKVVNDLPGKDGPISPDLGFTYMLVNGMDAAVGHALAMARVQKYPGKAEFCQSCHMLIVNLQNYSGFYGSACACKCVLK